MTGDNLKQGLEGLSKIEGFSSVIYNAIYWIAVVCILLFVAYVFSTITCIINRKKRGENRKDNDDFLE